MLLRIKADTRVICIDERAAEDGTAVDGRLEKPQSTSRTDPRATAELLERRTVAHFFADANDRRRFERDGANARSAAGEGPLQALWGCRWIRAGSGVASVKVESEADAGDGLDATAAALLGVRSCGGVRKAELEPTSGEDCAATELGVARRSWDALWEADMALAEAAARSRSRR